MPHVLAAATFVSGMILLFSGAFPAASGRLAVLDGLVPLPAIEASHFIASAVGAALLLLARGLQRRLDAAWLLAVMLLPVGVFLSAAKGWDFEEAILLGVALIALLPFRQYFYRKSSLLSERFTAAWIASIGAGDATRELNAPRTALSCVYWNEEGLVHLAFHSRRLYSA